MVIGDWKDCHCQLPLPTATATANCILRAPGCRRHALRPWLPKACSAS